VIQGSEQWHEARRGRITGSMFAAVLGLSPYVSRQKAWRIITGREPPQPINPAMQWGIDNEENARNSYEIDSGNIVRPCGFHLHPAYSFIGCTPDGFVRADGVVEFKCPQRLYEEIPDYYLPQILGEIHITGREWCDFTAWTPERHWTQRVERDEKAWKEIEEKLVEFWQEFVLKDVEPPRKRRTKNGV